MPVRGVFVGRLCPPHLGHEQIIRTMLEVCGGESNSLVILGSSGTKMSLRHFFTYLERRYFVLQLFPQVQVVPLPDFEEDADWYAALDDLLRLAGFDPEQVTFFGGCEEDLRFFAAIGRKTHEINRFNGETPKISATELRDALLHDRPLDALLNPLIHADVKERFKENWERFKHT